MTGSHGFESRQPPQNKTLPELFSLVSVIFYIVLGFFISNQYYKFIQIHLTSVAVSSFNQIQ
jgi:hypothetical protein